jgi:hypothetical protein
MTLFAPAVRTKKKLRIALDGPSGAGKTYSALLIASGLTGGDLSKVALVDTEHGSASLYSHLGPFAVAEMHPPYSVEKYVQALAAAAAEGYEVVVLDSLTHAWSGEGGLLDYVDRVAKTRTSGNSFAAWKEGTPLQKQLTDAILGSACHVIVTMRTKTEYVIEENERGKKVPRKIGLAPEQRKDFEYDMDLVLDLTREHLATASKDRTGVWAERMEVPAAGHGEELVAWLAGAAPPPPDFAAPPPDPDQLPLGAQRWQGMVDAAAELGVTAGRLRHEFDAAGCPDPEQAPVALAKRIYALMQEGVARRARQDEQREQAAAGRPAPDPTAAAEPRPAPPPPAGAPPTPGETISAAQAERLRAQIHAKGYGPQAVCGPLGLESLEQLPRSRFDEVAGAVASLPDRVAPARAEEPASGPQEPAEAPAAAEVAPDPQEAPEQPAAASEKAPAPRRPDGCLLDDSFMSCAAIKRGEEPPCESCEHYDADFAPLDAALRSDAAAPAEEAPQWGVPRKTGTVDAERLKRLGMLCADLEQQGVTTEQWRRAMLEREQVVSRRELSKAAADRMARYLKRWLTDLESGVEPLQEEAVA